MTLELLGRGVVRLELEAERGVLLRPTRALVQFDRRRSAPLRGAGGASFAIVLVPGEG